MSRILFVMLHPGFIRYYEGALHALAARGHDVHVAFEINRTKLGEDVTAQRLAASSVRISCGTTPERVESVRDFLARGDRTAIRSSRKSHALTRAERQREAWESLATTVRLQLDYLRYFEPAFEHATSLRDRARKRLPALHGSCVRLVSAFGAPARRAYGAVLQTLERIIPVDPAVEAFVREQQPDVLLVTPLIELGSQQVDYVKCARRLGVRSALCVASWDNLTSKGLIRMAPDHVIVWNDAQKREAVELHDVAPDRVVITGAQVFDSWFEARPSCSREEFCLRVGLDPDRPFVLYVGSSVFIAPEEVPFAERWVSALRASGSERVAGVGVLIRPHPANSRQWRAFDSGGLGNVALWPPIGTNPNSSDFRRDYFDSLYHSAAVVGINTSAQLEAGIVGRPVFTICAPEFAHSQAGTLHFRHLVDSSGGHVHAASTLDEHVEQLAAAVDGRFESEAANRELVRRFIRPLGEDVPVAPVFAQSIEDLCRLPRPTRRAESTLVRAVRPIASIAARAARTLAEGRPVWVYAMRPLVALAVRTWAAGYRMRSASASVSTGARRMGRQFHRTRYESLRYLATLVRRARKRVISGARRTGGAVKRAGRRAGVIPADAGRKNA